MQPTLLLIRGAPATGKSTLARNLAGKLKGKKALLIVDEFRWIMTAHHDRDMHDYSIAFDNYLYALENYLKAGYTVITEDTWVRKHKDQATDIQAVLHMARKYDAHITQILLQANFETIQNHNRKRPMVNPEKELHWLYNQVYSYTMQGEVQVAIEHKTTKEILGEVISYLQEENIY